MPSQKTTPHQKKSPTRSYVKVLNMVSRAKLENLKEPEIYIIYHQQRDCFVVSQHYSEARDVQRLKPGSKPAQLYVRLSIIPHNYQANHVGPGIIRYYILAFVCIYLCFTGYLSARFIWRVLHYTSGNHKFLRQSGDIRLCVCVCVWEREREREREFIQ